MLQRLRQISISSSLRGAFLTGALLTLIVSSVSLYSWHEQSSQIRYSLDEYFPRIHAAFLIEGNLNLVVDQLNEFLLAPNTTVRLQLRNQIIQHLDKIERLSQGLSPAERQQLGVILQDSRALLAELDRVLYNMFLVREKVGELAARIDWLHDDFTTELNSLVQDFTWQQGTLLDQIEARQGDARQYLKRAREVQNEQQQVYFIRSRLVKRFTALNQAVVQIGLGRTEATIPVYGRDELGRIAGLLRHTLGQLNAQKQQLEQEIGERKAIEADLRATQDELIQTAKLAVVGQTMTTLAHEINQPLNALSMYLFTAGRAIEQGQAEQARTTLSKAEGLINRIDAIIRSLRQFTRRAELETPLHPVDLRQTFTVAWELLAMRHKPQQGTLVIPDDTVWIQGDEVRVHQVLVNVLSNALDACPHAAQITVSWQIQGGRLCVLIADNGPGWPAALLPSLLKPFTTSKTVGLGIGLSICVSLMTQMEGALRLASTFTRSACVVLEFNLTDVKDVE
ncbi:ATP-binding protein [Klebsiella pneumoniae]|uniref:ATP-binding protein n=1 Tax=Klebsiella pneumoniae TaxID=573 RepID=UPI0018FF3CFE|nr:ATP-binding protein [Klebsiella pneumoniae]